jgi:hypothetical protein
MIDDNLYKLLSLLIVIDDFDLFFYGNIFIYIIIIFILMQ